MSVICFATYEIHPTTWGGCGVLLHHASERLLRAGHEVIFLLDIPIAYFERFNWEDRERFTNAHLCRAYHVDTLCEEEFSFSPEDVPGTAAWKSLRFAHALRTIEQHEHIDFVEFFEYCGPAHYALAERLFEGSNPERPRSRIVGSRLHNSIELIDRHGATNNMSADRFALYALERAALRRSEVILTPTPTYFEAYYRDEYRLDPRRVVVSQSPKLEFPKVTRRPDPQSGDPFTIVYMGRVHQFKGVDQLIHAASALFRRRPDVAATIELIGPDNKESPLGESYFAYLRTLIPPDLRDRFRFAGHLDHEAIADRLNNALFGVFPNRFESFCYAAHEVYDAGVPVIVRDLPGWSDFFVHEHNALVYDGSTAALTRAMERLIDDAALRARLTFPYPIAQEPLGEYYDAPRIPEVDAPSIPRDAMAVVLVRREAALSELQRTLASLRRQRRAFDRILLCTEAAVAAETETGEVTWWLGRPWRLTSVSPEEDNGPDRPIGTVEATCGDSLVILEAGDELDANWLRGCTNALSAAGGDVGFAGTWARGEAPGRVRATLLDAAPETWPFEHGSRPTRCLLRTPPGTLLVDLFESDLGAFGEIAYLWKLIGEIGPGVISPAPMLTPGRWPDANLGDAEFDLLHSLLIRHGAAFGHRLALRAGLGAEEAAAQRKHAARPASATPRPPLPDVSVDYKIRVAGELGGRTLMKMVLNKAARRIAGRSEDNSVRT